MGGAPILQLAVSAGLGPNQGWLRRQQGARLLGAICNPHNNSSSGAGGDSGQQHAGPQSLAQARGDTHPGHVQHLCSPGMLYQGAVCAAGARAATALQLLQPLPC